MKNNLEDIFKVLQDHTEEAPDLMAAIHAKRSAPLHRLKLHLKSHLFKYAAAIVVLLSISFFVFKNGERIQENPNHEIAEDSQNLDSNNPNSTNQNNNNSQLENKNDNIDNSVNHNLHDYTQIEDGSDNNTKSTKIEPTIKSNSTIDQVETYPIDPNQTPSTEPEADPQDEKIADQPPVRSIESDKQDDVDIDQNVNDDNKKVEPPIVIVEDQPTTDSKDDKIEDQSSEDKKKESIPTTDEKGAEAPIADDKNIDQNVDIARDSAVADQSNSKTIPEIPNKSFGLKKFSIEVLAGIGKVGPGIYSENEYSGIRNASEKQISSFQASVLFNYELLNNLELQTGLNYNSSRFDVDYLNKYTKTSMDIQSKEVLIFDYPGAPGRKVTLHDTTYNTENVEDEYKSSNLVQSYQVPLSLRYHFVNSKKFSAFAKFGANIEMHKTLEGKVLNPDYTWAQLGADAYIRRDYLSSYQVGFGANYVLSSHVALVFEYLTQRSLKSIWTTSSPVNELQINNSLKAGLKFNF